VSDFLTALTLLTVVSSPRDLKISARALMWYPFVGAILGSALVIATVFARRVFPEWVTAVMIVALWAVLTGGLHLDGFTDSCDALFATVTRERRLEILRDVHLGALGAAGLILLLMLKASTLATISLGSIFIAPILGRWAMVYAATFPLARRDGMAALFVAGLSRREILAATIFTALVAGLIGWTGWIAFVAAFAVATLIARFALERIGGLTGDIYGMICESVEVSVLLVGVVKIF
jgi:adenosylcobinamide-GDP ribazoletransferase